jgi:pimeloyl-ACP methyl ester carboxylesterase
VRRRLRLAAIIATAATLAACTTTVSGTGSAQSRIAPPSQSSAAPQPPAQFSDCTMLNLSALPLPADRQAELTFSCATIDVPLDYSDPGGRTIQLELLKVHDSHNHTGNSLVINPGGPGGSGVIAALSLSIQVSEKLLSSFDLIGFDPRGVGLSTPVTCISDAQKDALNAESYDIRTASGFAAAKATATQFAQACERKYGDTLPDYNTVQTAKDMDRIRQALGGEQLNYLGFSYGTELGGVYLHLFPDNARVAVLDGAVDPLTDPIPSFANQIEGFEKAFDQFAANCLTRSSCAVLGNPRQVVYQLVATATAHAIPSGTAGDPRSATSALVLTGVAQALYSQDEWPALGDALVQARSGASEGLLKLADEYNERRSDGSYTNILDANTAISCNDSPVGPTDAVIRATAQRWASAYPMFGLSLAQSLFSCAVWQPHRTPVPKPTAATPQKVLVIGNLHDPATPYQGAKDLARTLGNAELLSWDGEGHTSYLSGSTCIDNYVNSYLIGGTLPPDNTTCPR